MKKRHLLFFILLPLVIVNYILFNFIKTNNVYTEIPIKQTKINKSISMNLEQTAGVGDYKTVTQSSWPTEGYELNTELSRCENGSTLSWDDTNQTVVVSGNISDKCYIYFDKLPLLVDYILSQYTGIQGENGIYYHNSSLTNGAGDNSYRYSGANPNNYVCFGTNTTPCPEDNLYRIIGVIDGKIKIIKYTIATTTLLGTDGAYAYNMLYYWDAESNTWSESLLNTTNLNTNFINNIGSSWSNKITTTTWKVGGNTLNNIENSIPASVYQNEIVNPVTTNTTDNVNEYSAKIGLMYVSDYGFAAGPDAWTLTMNSYSNSLATSTNWLYGGALWTITRISDYSNVTAYVYDGKISNKLDTGMFACYVLPVFFLESSVTYKSGVGTKESPIILGN